MKELAAAIESIQAHLTLALDAIRRGDTDAAAAHLEDAVARVKALTTEEPTQ